MLRSLPASYPEAPACQEEAFQVRFLFEAYLKRTELKTDFGGDYIK